MKNIICIDDSDIVLDMCDRIISKSGVAKVVKSFCDASEALDWFKTHGCNDIDLILLDINMPKMNGFEFLEKFNQLKIGYTSVVCFVTSSKNPVEIDRAHSLGAKFSTKPLTNKRFKGIFSEVFLAEVS